MRWVTLRLFQMEASGGLLIRETLIRQGFGRAGVEVVSDGERYWVE